MALSQGYLGYGVSGRFSLYSGLYTESGGREGIRICPLYGNKEVSRRSLAFYGIEKTTALTGDSASARFRLQKVSE